MGIEFCVNQVILDTETEALYLVLWISPGNEYGYWYDLNSSSRKPSRFQMCDVSERVRDGHYEVDIYSSSVDARSEDTLTEKELSHRDRIWNIMKTAVETEPDIYDKKLRSEILRKVADVNGLAPNNLYKWLDYYWRSGKTKNAFIPKYFNCGGKGKEKNSYRKKDSQHSSGAGVSCKSLENNDRLNFAAAIKKYYLTRQKMSFKIVYEKLLQDFYTVQSADSNGVGKLKLLPPHELPSLRQFRYWYSKNRDIVSETKNREGESTFNLDKRSVLGKSDYGLMGPGSQFQIDATVGDIYLVSQFDRSNLIGRPVLYFVIDAFSRMVVGVGIALEGPSWGSAMMAIINMASDKVAYCGEYGIDITESDWPCHHVPAVLIGDRGEMESRNADNLVNILGIRIVNTPPYRADWKGIVEQHFRTINTNSIALLPGSVKPDMSKRGGKDYRLDATLDIWQFTQIIIKCVLYYNNHHYMDYFEKSEDMMRDNVDAIPSRIWEWGIRHCSGALRSFPEETVRMAVLPTDKATVTAKGIKFKGAFYSSDRTIGEAWFEKARSGKTWAIKVSYDPRDMANIYIWNKDDKKYDACYLLEWNQKYAGKYLDEVIYEQKKEAFGRKQLKLSEIEAKVNLNAEIDAIVTNAKDMSASLSGKSKKERISNIKENRRNERDSMRLEVKLAENTTEEINSVQTNNLNEDIDPILQMIRSKLEERLKNE